MPKIIFKFVLWNDLTVFCVITGRPVAAFRGQEEFRMSDHSTYLREGRAEVRKRSVLRAEVAPSETSAGAPVQDTRRLQRATKAGEWITVQPSKVNGTELIAQEWRD